MQTAANGGSPPLVRFTAAATFEKRPLAARVARSGLASDTFEIVQAARRCVEAAWPKQNANRYAFVKAGAIVDDLLLIADRPRTLFDVPVGPTSVTCPPRLPHS